MTKKTSLRLHIYKYCNPGVNFYYQVKKKQCFKETFQYFFLFNEYKQIKKKTLVDFNKIYKKSLNKF